MNELKANQEGEILEILVKDGQMMEYDQPLFVLGDWYDSKNLYCQSWRNCGSYHL